MWPTVQSQLRWLTESRLKTGRNRNREQDRGYFWHITDFHYDPQYSSQGDTRRRSDDPQVDSELLFKQNRLLSTSELIRYPKILNYEYLIASVVHSSRPRVLTKTAKLSLSGYTAERERPLAADARSAAPSGRGASRSV
ncbi:hypothetical protein EVAR_32803_1 [Eumeta japonica]|uniref:Uncharacterized protein n=1 Tax=Eumeta variegata TaxID=151549 RepID=A0A4C1WEC6_EUMVA|nr:hypothetical protein EVAR_32803_1 [Eumeta japonica]